MTAHLYTPTAGSRSACEICGKTRNVKAHKEAKALDAQVDAATEVEMAKEGLVAEEFVEDTEAKVAEALAADAQVDTGMTEDELDAAIAEEEIAAEDAAQAEPWGIPPVPDFVPSADDEAPAPAAEPEATPEPAQAEQEAPAPAKAAPAKRSKKDVETGTVRLWVGWRITNAAVLLDATKAHKSLAAKLKAAKPTSELDRYVRLTVDELKALDEVGVAFEAQGNTGPVIYSARTMRRRIAAAIDTLENEENTK